MATVIFLFTSIATLVLGFFVLLVNTKNLVNKSFFALCLAIVIWNVGNFFADIPNDPLLWARVTFFGAALIGSFYYLFASVYPNGHAQRRNVFIMLTSMPMALFVLSPFVVTDVTPRLDDANNTVGYDPVYGFGYILFGIVFLVLIILASYSLYKKSKHLRGVAKTKITYLMAGLIVALASGILTNLILPIALGSSTSAKYAPLSTFFVVALSSYAIIKHNLFNIRMFVARAVTYILVFGLIIGTLAIIGPLMLNRLTGSSLRATDIVVLGIFSVILAMLYQPIKAVFDKLTNNLFYKDAYTPQDVINKVNASLVTTVDFKELLTNVGEVLTKELKLSYTDFYVDKGASIQFHVVGTNKGIFKSPKWESFLDEFTQSGHKHAVHGQEGFSTEFNSVLQKHYIGCVVRLSAVGEDIGFMIVGERSSGSVFTGQDIQLLEIVADDVALATQNALHFEEITHFNITLQEKIQNATRELQKSNDKLLSLDQAKDDFISMASHQLRTPLTSIKGYLSMMLDGDAGPLNDQQKKFLHQAFISSQRMVYLIADLLNVSRIKTGTFIIEKSDTDIITAIKGEIEQLIPTAEARGLTINFDLPKELPNMNVDETKIRQVVMNFVDNAIYYSKKGGHIKIAMKQTAKSVEFTVTDDGIGVPKDMQHLLFVKFYRAENAKKARPDGTGLGLYMAKKVIIAHGGAIIFKSTEGKGSTFGFSLPMES